MRGSSIDCHAFFSSALFLIDDWPRRCIVTLPPPLPPLRLRLAISLFSLTRLPSSHADYFAPFSFLHAAAFHYYAMMLARRALPLRYYVSRYADYVYAATCLGCRHAIFPLRLLLYCRYAECWLPCFKRCCLRCLLLMPPPLMIMEAFPMPHASAVTMPLIADACRRAKDAYVSILSLLLPRAATASCHGEMLMLMAAFIFFFFAMRYFIYDIRRRLYAAILRRHIMLLRCVRGKDGYAAPRAIFS